MSEPQPLDRSFRGWYGRTIGKWWIITQIAFWIFFYPFIPLAWLWWRMAKWVESLPPTSGNVSATRSSTTHVWVQPTVTKRGRLRRGHWRRK